MRWATSRSALLLAAHAAGVDAPVDGARTDAHDTEILRSDCAHALALGFPAKLCIHPRQVAPVHEAFLPTEEQVRWAEEVIAVTAAGGAVSVLDGKMIDNPVVDRARTLLDRRRKP